MDMKPYYKPYYMQNWISAPDGFGGVIWKWADGAQIMGMFKADRSSEMMMASAQDVNLVGTFATDINVQIEEGDIIREEDSGHFFRLTSIPEKSPDMAETKIQTVTVEKVLRP